MQTEFFDISGLSRITFRQDINGLRGIAVLGVVFYHADFIYFKGGWLGVDIFFLISGYLISNIIISELNAKKFSFKNFYLRRVKRILPALFSTLFITSIFSYFILSPDALIQYSKSLIASIFFGANYYFQNLDFYNLSPTRFMPLIHMWSLAIEEQFYLLFPLLTFTIYKVFKKYLFIFFLFLSTFSILINLFISENYKFYQFQFRVWEFILGGLLMVLNSKISFKGLDNFGFPILLFSYFYFDDLMINSLLPKVTALLGVALILISNNDASFTKKLLNSKIITLVGTISFSFYLLHQPLFAFYRIYLSGRFENETRLQIFLLILFLLILSYISFVFVETAIANSKFLYMILLILLIFLITFAVFAYTKDGLPSRFQDTYNMIEKYFSEEQRGGPEDCDPIPNFAYFCTTGVVNDKDNLIVLGDSHLRTLSNYLDQNLKKDFNIYISITDGCPFLIPIKNNLTKSGCGNTDKLEEYNTIRNSRDTIVVFGGRLPWYYNGSSYISELGTTGDDMDSGGSIFLEGLKQNIDYLNINSKKLIIVEPIPELGIFPLEAYLYEYYKINESITHDVQSWINYSNEINEIINYSGAEVVHSTDIFCDSFVENKCTASRNGVMFYYDDDHLTLDGASLIGEKITEIIQK